MKKLSTIIKNSGKDVSGKSDQVFINDSEVIDALNNYIKGKTLEKESKMLIDSAKEVLERKLFNLGINNAVSDKYEVLITPYITKRFNSSKFKEDNPKIYDQYTNDIESTRYNIKERIVL